MREKKRKKRKKKESREIEISEIKKLVRENSRQIKELREAQKKADEQIKELREAQKKTDEQLRKTDEQIKKTDEQISRTEKQVFENSRQINRLKDFISGLTSSWGDFTEGFVAESCAEYMRRKYRKVRVMRNVEVEQDGKNAEYDIVVASPRIVLLVSVKTTVRIKDIKKLLSDMEKFFDFMPEYSGKRLRGGIAGINWRRDVEEYALRNGIIVFKPSGNLFMVKEPKKIKEIRGINNKHHNRLE